MSGDDELVVAPGRVVRGLVSACLLAELGLVLLDLTIGYGGLISFAPARHLCNLARERSFGGWFSSTQALAVGVVLGLVAAIEQTRDRRRGVALGWAVLAAFFVYVAIDDALAIHEQVGAAVRKWRASSPGGREALPSYAWHFVYAPVFGSMAILLLWLPWRALGRPGDRRFLVLGLGCYVAAVLLDFVEGMKHAHDQLARAVGLPPYTLSHFAKVVEELLEMLGTTSLLGTFSAHLGWLGAGRRVRIAEPSGEPEP